MGNAEMGKILEYVEKLFAMYDSKCKETEKKMYANEEMSIEDRIHYTTKFCEYNAVCIALNGIISLIKGSFETEKFWEEKKQDNCLKEKDCIFGRGNLCDKCTYDKKNQEQEQEQIQIANPIRKELIAQLEELVNPAQAEAIKEIEKDLLSPINVNNNISFVTWMHRIQGVIQVAFKTPEYTSETKDKIYKIINKLIEMKCL